MGLSSTDEGKETAMTEPWLGVVEKVTEFFATAQIEACARRTGFVQRTSKITGKVFLAMVTVGTWSLAKTSLAQLAAKGAQLPTPVDFSPEALHQRMTQRAVAFLRAMLQRAFAKLHSANTWCDDGLFAAFTAVHIADSTGFALPATLQDSFPGNGGGASVAGAKIQLVWEYLSHSFAHLALVAGTTPDSKYIDTVVQLAQRGALFLFDLGYFKMKALAQIAQAEAYFLTRHHHQATLCEAVAGQLRPVELAAWLRPEPQRLLERPLFLGAQEQVAVRLIAARVPDAVVNERRRKARKAARKRGHTPSQAHLTLLAWNLFLTNVPRTVWMPTTVCKAYGLRWQVELVFKSWKSDLHLATLSTKTQNPTLCYLYGRLLLIVLTYALCPALRTVLWNRHQRELSFLKLIRSLQAVADRWLQQLFMAATGLYTFLQQVCRTAARLVSKASRKRRTSAQRLRESLATQNDFIELTIKLAA
jgi:DDE family transposase